MVPTTPPEKLPNNCQRSLTTGPDSFRVIVIVREALIYGTDLRWSPVKFNVPLNEYTTCPVRYNTIRKRHILNNCSFCMYFLTFIKVIIK